MKKLILSLMTMTFAVDASALKIIITNDDGLTSNVVALTNALRSAGHQVAVSVPCTGQSGRGGALVFYSQQRIVAENDAQITANGGCTFGIASIGDPAMGPFKKSGFTDYHYVHGTPVVAAFYGMDSVAKQKWGTWPDLVISGPNEGQNVGGINLISGTVGAAQFVGVRNVPSIAVSAGENTASSTLNNPRSAVVANHVVNLVAELQTKAGGKRLLPKNVVLNVNMPNNVSATTPFAFSKVGTFNKYDLSMGSSTTPVEIPVSSATASQKNDEAVVSDQKISVTALQVGFESSPVTQSWLKLHLKNLFR
jgi:5'/3'-nucleotidase SurE